MNMEVRGLLVCLGNGGMGNLVSYCSWVYLSTTTIITILLLLYYYYYNSIVELTLQISIYCVGSI